MNNGDEVVILRSHHDDYQLGGVYLSGGLCQHKSLTEGSLFNYKSKMS